MSENHYRLCSSCKKPIQFSSTYYRCSVSTCNRKRTELTFCSVPCWDAHVPQMRHKNAWAEEERAPSLAQHEKAQLEEADRDTQRQRRQDANAAPLETRMSDDIPREILIVASKLKKYIKAKSGMNTSESAIDALSDVVRAACDDAIRVAAQNERRTVLDRDFDIDPNRD